MRTAFALHGWARRRSLTCHLSTARPQDLMAGSHWNIMQTWYAFRRHAETYFGFGSKRVAERFLRFLNRNQGADTFIMDRVRDLFPTPSPDELKHSVDRVDMKAEMKGWRG